MANKLSLGPHLRSQARRLRRAAAIKIGGYQDSGPPLKNAPAAFLRARFQSSKPVLPQSNAQPSSSTASRSLATALPEGALARGLLCPSMPTAKLDAGGGSILNAPIETSVDIELSEAGESNTSTP
jgi:hypothetical protein